MIYALVQRDTCHAERSKIARAIQSHCPNVIRQLAENGTIIHIMNMQDDDDRDLFCIHCCNPVFPSRRRPPGARRTWHFEHCSGADYHTPGECVGRVRWPPIPSALGIENPAGHGCYIRLDREIDENNGNPSDQHRTRCKTIDSGETYCHLARQERCLL